MGKHVTEMLKATLEGTVLAILSDRPAYGYEITAWPRMTVCLTVVPDASVAVALRETNPAVRGLNTVAIQPDPLRTLGTGCQVVPSSQGISSLSEITLAWVAPELCSTRTAASPIEDVPVSNALTQVSPGAG
ncbi:hypothetical protein [Nonomuraea sp. NPDC050643]|uniref:hypothetical protein n=1 Tax=Nonomuraea sp. NPDC050643 TaxID=3155660 RepID=UPI0033DE2D76